MLGLVRGVGIAYALAGLSVAVYPGLMLSVDWGSRSGLLLAAALRLAVGVVLVLAGPSSRFPRTLRVFGSIAIVAAVVMSVMSFFTLDDWAAYMQWWMEQVVLFRVVFGLAATSFGVFLVLAASAKTIVRSI